MEVTSQLEEKIESNKYLKYIFVDEAPEIFNIQFNKEDEIYMSALVDRDGLKIIKNLKGNTNSDNLYKFKEYLINLHKKFQFQNMPNETQTDFFQKSCIIRLFKYVKDHVFKNLDDPNLYSLFSTFKDLLLCLKNEENLKMFFNLDSPKIQSMVNILDDTMQSIIYKQVKMKNSRRNLKTKLRLQRRLNEMKNEIEKINS